MEKQERLAYWKKTVAEFRSSGLGAKAFCSYAGIKVSTLYYWIKKLNIDKLDAEITEQLPEWISIPVKLKPSNISARIGQVTIDVGSGCNESVLMLVIRAC